MSNDTTTTSSSNNKRRRSSGSGSRVSFSSTVQKKLIPHLNDYTKKQRHMIWYSVCELEAFHQKHMRRCLHEIRQGKQANRTMTLFLNNNPNSTNSSRSNVNSNNRFASKSSNHATNLIMRSKTGKIQRKTLFLNQIAQSLANITTTSSTRRRTNNEAIL